MCTVYIIYIIYRKIKIVIGRTINPIDAKPETSC